MKEKLFYAAMAFTLMTSCANNEVEPAISGGSQELGISATALSGTVSRAFTSSFTADDSVAIFINGTRYTPKIAKYKKVDDTNPWTSTATGDNKIYLTNDEATVYGFYPATAAATLGNAGNSTLAISVLEDDNFSAKTQIDYMYATAPSTDSGVTYPLATATNNTAGNKQKVELVFHHALVKLSFIVNRSSSYAGVGEITGVELVSKDNANKFETGNGTMKVADGTLAFTASSDSITYTGKDTINVYSDPASTVPTVEQIVAPKTSTASIILKLTIDGKIMSVALPTTEDKWEAGNNYAYTITVKGTELVVTKVSILKWIDKDAGNADVN